MQITWKKYRLPLEAFTISKGTFHHRDCLVVQLTQDNYSGLGEATEISYYQVDLAHFESLIAKNHEAIAALHMDHPHTFYEQICLLLGDHPFLISAFDCAAWDLYGKMRGRSTRDLIPLSNQAKEPPPITSYTLGMDSPEACLAKMKANPWPAYKIKLGGTQDLAVMSALHGHTDAAFRVDANEGWSASFCRQATEAFVPYNVELIEQPLSRAQDDQMAALKKTSPIPYFADESCQGLADVEKCQIGFDGINIKLMKCGGITPAISMIEKARSLGLKIMIGCMTESSIGISAAAQLLSWVDYADLDGAMLIQKDIASGVQFEFGEIKYVDEPGHGCSLYSESV